MNAVGPLLFIFVAMAATFVVLAARSNGGPR